MRERWRQANRATVPSAGPLRRVLTLDGHRLATCLPRITPTPATPHEGRPTHHPRLSGAAT